MLNYTIWIWQVCSRQLHQAQHSICVSCNVQQHKLKLVLFHLECWVNLCDLWSIRLKSLIDRILVVKKRDGDWRKLQKRDLFADLARLNALNLKLDSKGSIMVSLVKPFNQAMLKSPQSQWKDILIKLRLSLTV